MNTVRFEKAKAIFASLPTPEHATVNQYGFYCALTLTEDDLSTPAVIRLTARNFYRLYINGNIVMHGPARTAHGYCRVDELTVTKYLSVGVNHIAVEVMEYGEVSGKSSNDCTLESGLLTAELTAGGRILSATGGDGWQVCRLAAREPYSERISHCRECAEIYTLDEAYESWRVGKAEFSPAVLVDEPVYLTHDALMPTLQAFPFSELVDFGACRIDGSIPHAPRASETGMPYFALLREHPLADCRRSVRANGQVKATRAGGELTLDPLSTDDFYADYDSGENRVGFVRISVTCERAGVIDIVPTELLLTDGQLYYGYNFVTRLHVPAGRTEFVAMEPMIARYARVFFRGVGKVTVHELSLLDDTYPDEHRAAFLCSDENLNRLYGAAKQTMLLNTLDVFMDCPGRERGGWLCDSLWTARAAALMLSDHRAEREFLENFLLTPPEDMFRGFFPAVYPNSQADYKSRPSITTWSFWLMCEVCEYVRRTGDTAFRDEYKPRIKAFVEGASTYIGKTGLMENLPSVFIDWSLSNQDDYRTPVSTPANALFAYAAIRLGETFGEPAWVELGQSMQAVLRGAILGAGGVTHQKHIPDSFSMDENGGLRPKGRYTEAAMYTTLWTGIFTADEAPELVAAVRDQMGPAPLYPKTPYVGISGLFIGLCIRLDMLARLGYVDTMYKDMRAIYEPQLREGPGTLWENEVLDNNSRCHGFNGHAGVHLMRDVLGLDCPVFSERGEGRPALTIAPHICGLRWAKGTHETPDGIVSVSWRYDGESFTLEASLPVSMDYRIELPREVRMLDEDKVQVLVNPY